MIGAITIDGSPQLPHGLWRLGGPGVDAELGLDLVDQQLGEEHVVGAGRAWPHPPPRVSAHMRCAC